MFCNLQEYILSFAKAKWQIFEKELVSAAKGLKFIKTG